MSSKTRKEPLAKSLLKSLAILIPSIAAMYALYLLDKLSIWGPETLFKDVITISIMLSAMIISFLIFSKLYKRQ